MQIALFPGSFNPVHRGHIELAESLLNQQLADEVWMIVSPHNPLKDSGLADGVHRMAMLELALENQTGIKASDADFALPVPSYSINTLEFLENHYPEHRFKLMIGSDNALIFNQWKKYAEILKHYPVFVYPRRGYPVAEAIQLYPAMQALHTAFYDISSTAIRAMILADEDTSEWLHPAVRDYINQNNLYR
jgi:nicotinate-nucleotide adenylyltransferase